jgi:hypothetical protein
MIELDGRKQGSLFHPRPRKKARDRFKTPNWPELLVLLAAKMAF